MKIFYKAALAKKENKAWELQIEWVKPCLYSAFNLNFDISLFWNFHLELFGLVTFWCNRTRKQDHAGIAFNLDIFGFFIYYTYHDIRHWNYDEDRWETQEEIDAQNTEYQQSLLNNKNINNESTN